MKIEALNTESSFSGETRSLNSLLFPFGIPALIERMKQSRSWENGELNSVVLLRSQGKKILITALHEGTEIVSFQSGDSVTIQVVEGKLYFQNNNKSVTLSENQHLTITDGLKFHLTSQEETVFLLTILKRSCCLSEIESGVN
jgi:hypothetical protein